MTESKKAWRKPELIVLVRNKSEEAVLTACKAHATEGGPLLGFAHCDNFDYDPCNICESISSS